MDEPNRTDLEHAARSAIKAVQEEATRQYQRAERADRAYELCSEDFQKAVLDLGIATRRAQIAEAEVTRLRAERGTIKRAGRDTVPLPAADSP